MINKHVFTKEQIEKRTLSRKKNGWWKNRNETINKIRNSNIGKHNVKMTVEQRNKLSNWLIGHAVSDNTKQKISKANKGKKRTKKNKENISLSQLKYIQRLKDSNICHHNKGIIRSESTKNKIRQTLLGRKLSISHIENIIKGNLKNKHFSKTSIELKIESILDSFNIHYLKQKHICKVAVVDFFIPDKKLIIECDGCYWHGCNICGRKTLLARREIDRKRDAILKSQGYIILRFWEHDINNNIEYCYNKIYKYI